MASFGPGKQEQRDKGEKGQQQNSLYSLTLNEIENTILKPEKPLGSMDMGEFLTSIFSIEEDVDFTTTATVAAVPYPPPHHQASLAIPAPLCHKTVNQVWAEINQQPTPHRQSTKRAPSPERQPTFDEISVEDFLIRAGIVRPANRPSAAAFYREGGRMGNWYGSVDQNMRMVGSPMSPVVTGMQVVGSPMIPVPEVVTARRKRPVAAADLTPEMVEKRHQRKKMKNRESAARSRARKEVYTGELEREIILLTQQNDRMEKVNELLNHMLEQFPDDAAGAREGEMNTMGLLSGCSSCTW